MATITYDEFDIGLDHRKGASVSDANRLRELKNAYVSKGKVIRKRPGTTLAQQFTGGEIGTKGLVAGNGKLNTFIEGEAVTHGNSLFQCHRLAHPTTVQNINKIDLGDVFNGYLYVSALYADATRYHHYIDISGDIAYSNRLWATGEYCTAVANDQKGLRWKCTTGGTSTGEPTWTSAVGDTVAAGGGVIFTAESTWIADTNCPHSKSFIAISSKIYAIDTDMVRASGIAGAARVWDPTTPTTGGTEVPVSTNAKGSSTPTAVSQYDGRLSAYFSDNVQFYDTDTPKDSDVYYKSVEGVGTKFAQTPREFAGDTIFLAGSGFRSITTLANTNQNLAETDVGSPIDKLVVPDIPNLVDPVSEFFTTGGQYWCHFDGINPDDVTGPPAVTQDALVWAYTFSRTQKISAWARYYFPWVIDAMAVNAGVLYLRSGEKVYQVDNTETIFTDDGEPYEMLMEMPFLDFKRPGSTKYIASMDLVIDGSVDVQFRYDPNKPTLLTNKIRVTGDTRPYQSIPVEITSPAIAPVFSDTSEDDVIIHAITFNYEELGPV